MWACSFFSAAASCFSSWYSHFSKPDFHFPWPDSHSPLSQWQLCVCVYQSTVFETRFTNWGVKVSHLNMRFMCFTEIWAPMARFSNDFSLEYVAKCPVRFSKSMGELDTWHFWKSHYTSICILGCLITLKFWPLDPNLSPYLGTLGAEP